MTKYTLVSFIACPFAQRVIIALKEKKIDFENIYIDLSNKPDWFLKISPLGKVPVLRVQEEERSEVVIFESSVILEYLEEVFPEKKLYPADPIQRALHRAWMEFGSTIIMDFSKWSREKDESQLTEMRKTIKDKLSRIEEVVAGPYFGGNDFSCVDAAFGPFFMYLGAIEEKTNDVLTEGLPKLSAWREKLLERLSVKESLPVEDYASKYTDYLIENGSAVLTQAQKRAA